MCGARRLLLALLLAGPAACSPGTSPHAAASQLAAGATHRAASRSEEGAWGRAVRAGSQAAAAGPRRGGSALPRRRRAPRAARPARRLPPGAGGLRDLGAAALSHLSRGSRWAGDELSALPFVGRGGPVGRDRAPSGDGRSAVEIATPPVHRGQVNFECGAWEGFPWAAF